VQLWKLGIGRGSTLTLNDEFYYQRRPGVVTALHRLQSAVVWLRSTKITTI